MKNLFLLLTILTVFSGCCRTRDDIWEDTKTAKRHVTRGVRCLGGKGGDSRAVACREDFMPYEEYVSEGEYIPLGDVQNCDEVAMADFVAPQPRETPGDPYSSLPGIEAFKDPAMDPQLAGVFRTIHFDYNSYSIQGDEDLRTMKNISSYMRQNPHLYVFVAGHCDERGPEAYNLSLGSRRSNAVRNMLISDGVNPDNIFTISYGKERPLIYEHHEEAWAQNRRADFRVYQR